MLIIGGIVFVMVLVVSYTYAMADWRVFHNAIEEEVRQLELRKLYEANERFSIKVPPNKAIPEGYVFFTYDENTSCRICMPIESNP